MIELDAEIIGLARRGDPLAWEKLVRKHTKRIYNLCYRFTNRVDQAEDLTQDAFLKIFKNLESYSAASGNFVTWMVSVTRNLLIDHYRQSKGGRVTISMDEPRNEDDDFTLAETLPSDGPSPQAELEKNEEARQLRKALNQLSPDLREAVILRDLEDMSYQEIGTILKVPEGTVKSRINRGRLELAKCLQRTRRFQQSPSA